jgi:signal transduction histidine kinase
MTLDRLRGFLFPEHAEQDEAFRQELQHLARLGLRIVGALETAVPLLMLAAGIGVIPIPIISFDTLIPNLVVAGIGAASLIASVLPFSRRHGRLLTAISVFLTAATLEMSVFLLRPDIAWIDHYLIGHIILVQFGAAALPFKPVQTFALGLAIDLFYMASFTYAQQIGRVDHGFGMGQHLITFVITCACTALTSIVYRHRADNYETHQRALRAAEDLRKTQAKLLITENAAVMGRLAAALSHELNSPIGVLASAVETLSAAALKNGVTSESDRARVARVVDETHRAGRASAERLRSIVARMQRFTNLDRAEVQSIQLNDLIADVIAVMDRGSSRTGSILFQPGPPLPRLTGRPQQLSAVLANLIGNAIEATDDGGVVRISAEATPAQIEITIEDNGHGMSEEELENAFNPASFRVFGNRIGAANWSLFSCRQIVQEHGGEIGITSAPGKGTTVKVLLPVS